MKHHLPDTTAFTVMSTVFLTAIFSYFFLDMSVALWCHHYLTSYQVDIFSHITKFGDSTYYIIASALSWIVFRFFYKNTVWETRAKFFFIVLIASGLAADVIKVVAGRYRPSEWFEHHLYGFDFFHAERAMTSFPSGHSATIFAVAAALYYLWPKSAYLIWPIALSVALSRVAVGAHYPSDVLMGGYVGVMSVVLSLAYVKPKRFRPIRMKRVRAVAA